MVAVNVKHLWAQNPRATPLSQWCDKEKGRYKLLAEAIGLRKETVWMWAHQVQPPPLWGVLAVEVLTQGAVPAQSWLSTRCAVKVMRETMARQQDRIRAAKGLSTALSYARKRKQPTEIRGSLPLWFQRLVRDMSREESGPLFEVARHLRAGRRSKWLGRVSHKNYRGSLEERDLEGPTQVWETVHLYVDANARFKVRVVRDTVEYGLWFTEREDQAAARAKWGGPPCVDFSRYEWQLKEVHRRVKQSQTAIEANRID